MSEELETSKKTSSRKFMVWLLWSVLVIAIVVIGFIRANDELTIKGLEYYFWISGIYIGGNVATKGIHAFVENKKETE